ncbi:unnamed protein product [Prorocentrum cordatum]|nr:unnamed protein product [Polarella glacialis]
MRSLGEAVQARVMARFDVSGTKDGNVIARLQSFARSVALRHDGAAPRGQPGAAWRAALGPPAERPPAPAAAPWADSGVALGARARCLPRVGGRQIRAQGLAGRLAHFADRLGLDQGCRSFLQGLREFSLRRRAGTPQPGRGGAMLAGAALLPTSGADRSAQESGALLAERAVRPRPPRVRGAPAALAGLCAAAAGACLAAAGRAGGGETALRAAAPTRRMGDGISQVIYIVRHGDKYSSYPRCKPGEDPMNGSMCFDDEAMGDNPPLTECGVIGRRTTRQAGSWIRLQSAASSTLSPLPSRAP